MSFKKTLRTVFGVILALAILVLVFLLRGSQTISPQLIELNKSYLIEDGQQITGYENQMKMIEENQRFCLSINPKTTHILLLDKKTGKSWRSNPDSVAFEQVAMAEEKDRILAPLSLSYFTNAGQEKKIDCYNESIKKDQYKIFQCEHGIRVDYLIGDMTPSMEDFPKRLDSARFDELFLRTDALDESEKAFIQKRYALDKESGYYSLRATDSPIIIEQLVNVFNKIAYTSEELAKDMAKFGFEANPEERLLFSVSVIYKLTDDGLSVTVPAESIDGPESFPVASVTLMEFWGAVTDDVSGYMVIPDGSGALLKYGSKPIVTSDWYSKNIYGTDVAAFPQVSDDGQPIMTPVFGAVQNGYGYIGIIAEGDTLARINCYKAGYTNSLNCVFPTFEVNKMTFSVLGEELGSQNASLVPLFTQSDYKGCFSLEYRFSTSPETTYVDLAGVYRAYLESNGLIRKIPASNPLVVETVGAVGGTRSVLGIFQKADAIPLTTYSQNTEIIDAMEASPDEQIVLRLSGWFNEGLDQTDAETIRLIDSLGGKKGLSQLLQYCKDNTIDVYPNVMFLTSSKGHGFNSLRDAAKTIQQESARLFGVDLLSGNIDRTYTAFHQGYRYIYTPNKITSVVESFAKRMDRFDVRNLSLADLGSQVYADYSKNIAINRQLAKSASEMVLQNLKDKGYQLMSDKGRSFSGRFADIFVNVPLSSSNCYLFDESIPFFQTVYHGYIPYACNPINESDDYQKEFLKCLEYGSALHFRFLYQNAAKLKDSAHSYMFSNQFETWKDVAVKLKSTIQPINAKISDQPIVGHRELAPDVYLTEYDNGIKIYVNYSEADYIEGDITVPSVSFYCKE